MFLPFLAVAARVERPADPAILQTSSERCQNETGSRLASAHAFFGEARGDQAR